MKTILSTWLFFALSCLTLQAQKTIYIPQELQDNDFTNPASQWSYSRMAETPNVVCFWERGFGPDLSKAPQLDGHPMTVDLSNLLSRLEYFYQVYRDMMRFTLPGSKADRYKMMVMLRYSLEGTAYGGCYDDSIGALWIAPNRVQDKRLNCMAHELGHSFQIQSSCDGLGHGIGGGFFEMASQWMLWTVNPEWPTDENYHWRAFIQDANLPFLALQNIYRSPYMLEYWSMRRGMTVIARLFRECRADEDAAQAYMRLYHLSNEDFAREAVDCYSRLLTFDFPGKHEVNRRYAGEFVNNKPLGCFGANVIRVMEPQSVGKKKTVVRVKFEGASPADGYAYRLVAVNDQAEATYGDIVTARKGKATLTLPDDAKNVYLVVTGYPLGTYEPTVTFPREGEAPQSSAPHTYAYKYTLLP